MQPTLPSITEVAKAGTFGLKLPALPHAPFVGLRPFNSDESLLFFGRGEQTIDLLQELHRTHFVAILGSSGCGKSSLVRAGLIPKLKAGFLIEDRDRWLVATMKPGNDPLRNLAAALVNAILGGGDADAFAEPIRAGGAHAIIEKFSPALADSDRFRYIDVYRRNIIEKLSPALADSDTNLLLLVDQFEEIFRFGVETGRPEERAEAEDFVSIMLALAEQRRLPVYVVMTMRSDFLGDCDHFHGLPEAMNRSQYLVPRLTRQQRQQAIEGPIRLFGGSISPRLLDRLLNEVGDKSDQLPVMQHALMRTWEEWQFEKAHGRNSEVDIEHYEAVGGINNALSKDADAALTGMSEEDLKITERVFLFLTDIDARGRRIRRAAHMSEIAAIVGDKRHKIPRIIERFISGGRSFLTLTTDSDPLIDISHESLIRQWAQLDQWVEAESSSCEIYLRLANAAKRRKTKGTELWRGADLLEALEWREKNRPTAAWAFRYDQKFDLSFDQAMEFLQDSEKAEATWLKAVEIISDQRLVYKRAVNMAVTISQLRIQIFITVTIGLALAAYVLSMRREVDWQTRTANDQAKTLPFLYYVANMNLAQEAVAQKDSNRLYELLNAFLPSPENGQLPSAREFYWYHLWRSTHQGTATLKGQESYVLSVAFSPDGKTLASASDDKSIKLWDVGSRQPLATLQGHESDVLSVAFSPDGKTLASASSDKTVKLWDVGSRQPMALLQGHEASVLSVVFSPDGKTLASASWDKTVKLWDVASQQPLATLKGYEFPISSVAFSPDGKTLASASHDKSIKLWDMGSRQLLVTLKGHESPVFSVAFSPDGKTLASASHDQTVKLWDVGSRQPLGTLKGHEGTIWSVVFSPDGKTLASASDDQTVRLWYVATRQMLATLKNHESFVRSVVFSPDGKTLASAGGGDERKKEFPIWLRFAATDEEVAKQRNK